MLFGPIGSTPIGGITTGASSQPVPPSISLIGAPSTQQATSGTGAVTTALKTVSVILVTAGGAPISQGTVVKFAWFDQITPDLFSAPTDKGTVTIGDGGSAQVTLTYSLKTSGQVGWLVVTDSTGDPTLTHRAFSGPVAVTVAPIT